MEPILYIGILAVGFVVLAILLVIVLMRVGAIALAVSRSVDLKAQLETIVAQNERLERELRSELALARTESTRNAQTARGEQATTLSQFTQTLQNQLASIAHVQNERLSTLTQSNEQRLEAVRATVEQRLEMLRSDNAQKLEQIRSTVDEKLHATLEQRLGESFKLVSDRLEVVHKGLGEMQSLASGVGDLKKVLMNVKSRGGWGEVQLGALLTEMLAPSQFAQNVATRPNSRERVEFAVRFPGHGENDEPCWLPIDAKFPLEDYQRLQDAIERADAAAVESSRKALEDFFKSEARKIRDKYVEPPYTLPIAILFVPTEGLYAEAAARTGLVDTLQREYGVMLAGPTSLWALLTSLQAGFRWLAIEKQSTEVWRVLGAVKTDFGKFGDLLQKTRKQLDTVSNTLGGAEQRTRQIERKLRGVEALPEAESVQLLADDSGSIIDLEPDADVEPDVDVEPPVSRDVH